MVVIPLTRDAYHCLDSSLVFDPKFKSFKGNLKYWSWVFLVQFSTHSEILYDVIFSALEAYWPLNQLCATKSPFIMFFLIMDFTQGYVFFWWHTLSFLYSFLSHQT